jgi:hypothetical protein
MAARQTPEVTVRRPTLLSLLVVVALVVARPVGPLASRAAAELPARLTGAEYWTLSRDMSEPDGNFRSENMISNEMVLASLLPDVLAHAKPGGVYMGVGPEQNFSYIAVLRPRMAFITDIRRGNLHVLLMYKALFELSADRAELISRLFGRPRPAGLTATSTARQIMDGIWDAKPGDEAAYKANLDAVIRQLTKTDAIPLPVADIEGVGAAYRTFYHYGPAINYSASTALTPLGGFGGFGGSSATYRDLMTQTDANGQELSYLSSDEKFRWLKDFQTRNLLVPLVGNFAGPKTLRAIGDYTRRQGAIVQEFYVSTVEHYLRDAGTIPTFCASVASLPSDETSVFIRPGNVQQFMQVDAPAVRNTRVPTNPVVVGRLGTYQLGIVVPLKGGCG